MRYSLFGIEDERLCQMLQALLIDRFHLKFHRVTKTGRVYLLERSGTTLRLRPARTASARAKVANSGRSGEVLFGGGKWFLSNTAMPQLAKFAADFSLQAPVLDRTGLTGSFDYDQPTADPDSEANYAVNSSSFLRLIPELGLKLQRTEGPVETFVIDHAEKPSPN
ncbi:MAG: TIGR03435 family protein [Bryobacteraceae bacterium]